MFQVQSGPRRRAAGGLAAAAVALLSAAGVATAQSERPEPKGPAAARAIRQLDRAIDLINDAESHVRATRERCRFSAPAEHPPVTHDAPTPEVTGSLAALRRPQTATDQIPADDLEGGVLSEDEVYVDSSRTVTAANGKQFVIVPARLTPPKPRPASCIEAVRARLVRVTASETRRQRTVTLREYDALGRRERRAAAQPLTPYDEVLLFSRTSKGSLGGGGGGGRFSQFLKQGSSVSSGGDDSAVLTGLVPDGVASLTMTFPKRVSRGRYYKPRVFKRKVVVTAPVQENVFSVRVPRGAPDAFPSRTVWRAADGHVLHAFRR